MGLGSKSIETTTSIMAKTSKKRSIGEAWSSADHANRKAKQQKSSNKRAAIVASKQTAAESPASEPPPLATTTSTSQRRSIVRTRNSQEKRDAERLRLHMIKVQRHIDALKTRLQSWDPVEEKERQEKQQREEEAKKQLQLDADNHVTKKKKGRKGPETWQLRGAAKPAWQVYDFDTRYVDPHIKAHEAAQQKAARSKNIFVVFKGRFGQQETKTDRRSSSTNSVAAEDMPPQPFCREYLALLMQLALLAMEANKMKAAMKALGECIDLDGVEHPITNARCRLMRIYLQVNQPQLARSLWERCDANNNLDTSVWVRYSTALLEFVSWKLLQEEGSSRQVAEAMLAKAIQANVYCVYYLAFHCNFESVMEYTDEIEDAPEGTLEEAIEYCCSEQYSLWLETDGAIDWVRSFLGRALFLGGKNVTATQLLQQSDLDWNTKLLQVEQEHDSAADNEACGDSKDDEHDSKMYCGMFRTAMEMLDESGETRNILEGAVATFVIDDQPEYQAKPAATTAKPAPINDDANADTQSDDDSEDSD